MVWVWFVSCLSSEWRGYLFSCGEKLGRGLTFGYLFMQADKECIKNEKKVSKVIYGCLPYLT